jgi:hypothetical protein
MPQLDDDSDDFIYHHFRHTTTTSSAAISIIICHNVGSDALLPMTTRCFAGHPDHLI